MIVGIVSKHDHAKAHAAGLEADGHTVKILGSDGNIDFPRDLDVLVLRHLSASHGALERGRAWAKAHHVPIVAENGLSGIRMALEGLRPKNVRDTVMLSPTAPASADLVVTVDENAAIRAAVLTSGSSKSVSSFVKNLLAAYDDKPARFLYRCMQAFEGQAMPGLIHFKNLWRAVYRNFDLDEYGNTFAAFYDAGRWFLGKSPEERKALQDAFMRGDRGAGKFFNYPLDPGIAGLIGRTTAYLAHIMVLLDGLRPKRISVMRHAYQELSGRTQADPHCFALFRDQFDFDMTYTRGPRAEGTLSDGNATTKTVDPATAVLAANIDANPVGEDTAEASVLSSVQEEVLNLAIRMENLAALSSRLDSVDTDVGACEVALTKVESRVAGVETDTNTRLSDMEAKFTGIAGRIDGCYQSYYKIDGRIDKVLVALDTYRARIEDLEQANIQLAARLNEAIATIESFKSAPPSSTGMGLEAALALLKNMGAEVQIRICQ